jgi:hypothetical protein
MKTHCFLRAAAMVSGVLCVGHLSGRPWTKSHDAQAAMVVDAMKSYRFNAMGFERSYFDFYLGFGWVLAVYMLAQALVLWNLAALARSAAARIRAIIGIFCLANLGATILEGRFLFTVPLVVTGLITLCLALAFMTVPQKEAA